MKTRDYSVVALMSLSFLAMELTWTRIFSAEFFYSFAFLTLSLAILGLGLGALALRLLPVLSRRGMTGIALSLSALMALAGPPLVFRLGMDFNTLFGNAAMAGKFIVVVFLLGSSFFFGGIALALIFRRGVKGMPRLYMADLVGAGMGVVAAMTAMNLAGTPAATSLAPVPLLLAALLASRGGWKALPVGLLVLVVFLMPRSADLLEAKRTERAPVIYKHWDALSKVKMYEFEGGRRGLNIDNLANSPVISFDGDWAAADTSESEWDIDVGYLIALFDSCTFLSLGAGGGADVLQALDYDATEIHAVEMNAHINRMMLYGDPGGYVDPEIEAAEEVATRPAFRDSTGRVITLPEYSGMIYHDPRVRVVTEDARTYVRCFRNHFDVIYSLSSNTWAALGSGSFAFAENYLFTTEAFVDYWNSLSEEGFLSMEHQMYMPRIVAMVLDALDELGVENPTDHFAVYDLPQMRRKLLLLSKIPLTDEIRQNAYGELTAERFDTIHLLYPAADSLADNEINRIVQNGWESEYDSAATDISPCTDDRPFAAQLGRWDKFKRDDLSKVNSFSEFRGFPLSKSIIVAILVLVVVLILPLNILPFFVRGEALRPVPWIFFFLIGTAFMMIEILLIQKYALFIGASVYSIATVLLALLLSAGLGSRRSGETHGLLPYMGIAAWIAVDALLFGPVTGLFHHFPVYMRAAASAVLIFPVGYFMGMPFPAAALRVGERIDWGLAVNGAASVLGSVLVMLIAFSYGFTAALFLAGGLYLAAGGLFLREEAW